MMISHHGMGDNGNGPDRVIVRKRRRYHQCSQWLSNSRLQWKTLVSSGRRQRSRSRERAPVHVPTYTDDESAAVEPQGRVSDRSTSQGKERPHRQKGKKNTAKMKKPRDLPKAKKHKPMDSNEDDERPQNDPGTSSDTQPPVPVLPLQSGLTSKLTRSIDQYCLTSRTSTSTSSEDESCDNDMTITEKKNLAQQYKVHEVRTPEEQCSMQTLKTSLEPLQPLNLLCQYFLIINDKQKNIKDQLSLTILRMMPVNIAMNGVRKAGNRRDSALPRSQRSDQ